MKKIIFFSALFFVIIAGAIISCTKNNSSQSTSKSDNKKTGQLIRTNAVTYPIVTKYQKKGVSGRYDLMGDEFTRNAINSSVFDNISAAYIIYFVNKSTQQEKAYLEIIGTKNNTSIAYSFELLTDGDGFFEIQDPVNNVQSFTNHECKGNCVKCDFTFDGDGHVSGCKNCPQGGACVYTKTVTAQDGLSTADSISGAALIMSLFAVLIAL